MQYKIQFNRALKRAIRSRADWRISSSVEMSQNASNPAIAAVRRPSFACSTACSRRRSPPQGRQKHHAVDDGKCAFRTAVLQSSQTNIVLQPQQDVAIVDRAAEFGIERNVAAEHAFQQGFHCRLIQNLQSVEWIDKAGPLPRRKLEEEV